MAFDISSQRAEHYVHFSWSGNPNYDDVIEAWRRVFAALQDAPISRALLELSYWSTFDASEAFRTIAEARRFDDFENLKIARLFLGVQNQEAHTFSENVGFNRGLNLKTFYDDTGSAIEWLIAR